MKRLIHSAILILLVALSIAAAQKKHALSWISPEGASEYTQDHRIEVTDVPGHIVRLTALEWDFSKMEPVPSFNGVKVTSAFSALTTDYHNFNGMAQGYVVFSLENGDKIFSDFGGATQTTFTESGELNSSSFSGLLTLTGGTGDFTHVRGLFRQFSNWNLSTDKSLIVPTTFEGHYWFIGN